MDPCGPQKKIASKDYHVGWQKNLDSGAGDGKYGGGFNKKSGTKTTYKASDYEKYSGKVKGGIKHTYGVDGSNDPD